jgi:hypothetical protein
MDLSGFAAASLVDAQKEMVLRWSAWGATEGALDALVVDAALGAPAPRPSCLALVAEGEWHTAVNYDGRPFVAQVLEAAGDAAFVYTPSAEGEGGVLHHTILQLISMHDYDTAPQAEIDAATEAATDSLAAWSDAFAPPWTVVFDTLCLTSSGLVALGTPNRAYNSIRAFVRRSGLVKNEYHPQNICHCTLFRWRSRPSRAVFDRVRTLVDEWNTRKNIAYVFTGMGLGLYRGTWEMTTASGTLKIA